MDNKHHFSADRPDSAHKKTDSTHEKPLTRPAPRRERETSRRNTPHGETLNHDMPRRDTPHGETLNRDMPRRNTWNRETDSAADGLIEGRNAVMEAFRAGVRIDKVYLRKGEPDAALNYIASVARNAGAVVAEADRRKLDAMSRTHAHQGVIAVCAVREYVDVEELLHTAEERGEKPLLVVCDGITDPHNLGAIIRTAECAGAHGIILPKRRSAGLTAVVGKTSAGAVAHIGTARVPNLTATLKDLKKRGLWIFGADPSGTVPLYRTDLTVPAAVVIGSEGDGMSRLTAETCDITIQIPMRGKINSLNASAAAALILYEAVRQRNFS